MVGRPEFVGWWETVLHVVDGTNVPVENVLELILPDSSFKVFLDDRLIGSGRHVDFVEDPPGFTNVQETTSSFATGGPQLAIYRLWGDVLEYCKASEPAPRPTAFQSEVGSGWIHGQIRRIDETDPRIPRDY